MNEVREPWATALIKAGFVDGRGHGQNPSWTALGRASGIHTSTLTAMASGSRRTTAETVEAVAEALRVDVLEVSKWVGAARSEREPYRLPDGANLLTEQERKAVSQIITLLTAGRKSRSSAQLKGDGTNGGSAAEEKRPGGPGGVDPDSIVDFTEGEDV